MDNELSYAKFYTTKDRFEIQVLLAADCALDGIETDHLGRVHFRFADKQKCNEILKMLLSGTLKVYAHKVINAMQIASSTFRKYGR
jgi:hypothetical protein